MSKHVAARGRLWFIDEPPLLLGLLIPPMGLAVMMRYADQGRRLATWLLFAYGLVGTALIPTVGLIYMTMTTPEIR